jgi:hypothetical protein
MKKGVRNGIVHEDGAFGNPKSLENSLNAM